jgi:hypothetical protein
MTIRGAGRWALFAIVAVAALFFFPLARGSFQAVHGPTTALGSQQFRRVLFVIGALAARARVTLRQTLFAPRWNPGGCSSPSAAFAALLPEPAPLRC